MKTTDKSLGGLFRTEFLNISFLFVNFFFFWNHKRLIRILIVTNILWHNCYRNLLVFTKVFVYRVIFLPRVSLTRFDYDTMVTWVLLATRTLVTGGPREPSRRKLLDARPQNDGSLHFLVIHSTRHFRLLWWGPPQKTFTQVRCSVVYEIFLGTPFKKSPYF